MAAMGFVAMQPLTIMEARLAVSNLVEVEAMVPARAEQAQIARTLSGLDNLITLHRRKLEVLRRLKSALLDKMFV